MDTTARRYSIVLGQRMSWPDLLARARETESLGFDGLFLVDHFYGLFDLDHPTHEAYTMLAALAPFTQSIRLGVMVAGNTYRNPAFLLKQAITVDHISGGRVDFGVGAGWVEREHEAYGLTSRRPKSGSIASPRPSRSGTPSSTSSARPTTASTTSSSMPRSSRNRSSQAACRS